MIEHLYACFVCNIVFTTVCPEKSVTLTIEQGPDSENIPKPRNKLWMLWMLCSDA